jgi:RNA polymerase sigma factor (sigma-70 family)
MESAKSGDQGAAALIVDRYGKHVQRAVRRMLPNRLRTLYDSEDFGQAVWKSFFADRTGMEQFRDPASLIAYLAAVARNKVIDESRRRLGTKKHNLNRVLPEKWDSSSAPADPRTPTPSELLIADETVSRLSDAIPEAQKSILQLRMAGCSSREIAEITGIHERTVRRVIAHLANLVEK